MRMEIGLMMTAREEEEEKDVLGLALQTVSMTSSITLFTVQFFTEVHKLYCNNLGSDVHVIIILEYTIIVSYRFN